MKNFAQDKVVIVTGASSGIGLETALAFARAGAQVVLVARREAVLQEIVAQQPGLRLLAVGADITREADAARVVATTLERFGRIDILVNNAGLGLRGRITELTEADARQVMELNFFAAVRLIQAVLPTLRRQGAGQIVNVSSVIGVVATPLNSIYCASKFALRALSNSLRLELHGSGIDVISILPGYTDTPFFRSQIRYSGPERMSPFRGQSPAHVAAVIVRACRERRREVTLSFLGILGLWAKRWLPGLVDAALQRGVGRAATAPRTI